MSLMAELGRKLSPGPRRWLGPLAVVAAALFADSCATPTVDPSNRAAVLNAELVGRTRSTHEGVVVSANEIASRAGAAVLDAGGNAVDAAIATGFALAVVHPSAGNIGGGGFMVIRFPDGRATTFNFREKAPLAAHPKVFVDSTGAYSRQIQANSHIAVGVPGTVAGFALAHDRYGRRNWAELVAPAVRLAADGFVVSDALSRSLARQINGRMQQYPASLQAFSRDGEPFEPGAVLRQPDLARSMERIRDHGHSGFYGGETARLIVEEMRRGGGLITEEDLKLYTAQEREPIRGTYRGYEVIGMPPPSSGGVGLLQMLNILEGFDLESMGHGSARYIHHVTEAQRLAYRDRARYLADPDFADVPVALLTSEEHAAELRAEIDPTTAGISSPEQIALAHESLETTHYSVVDADGMAVSVTYTLESGYGSKITVPGAGFLLNNEMGDFNGWPGMTTSSGQIGSEPNLTRPGQRMLSSMTPTILARDGGLVAVYGSPGGRTIINTVLHLTLNLTEFGMGIEEALAAPRTHHQWLPDRLTIEERHGDEGVLAALRAMGHEVQMRGSQGQAHSVFVDSVTGERIGAPDPRSADAGVGIQ